MTNNVIVERINGLCEERGWSYYKLAKESGLAYSTINSAINGPCLPSLKTLDRFCKAFGIPLSEFFKGCEDKTAA